MKSTQDIPVPQKIVDQVVGQDEAVQIIKKAALQRRHVLLIGEPGTGKSMLGLALAELLPKSSLKDILALPNPNDENNPLIQTVQAGTGREEVKKYFLDGKQMFRNNNFLLFVVAIITLLAPWWIRNRYQSDIMFAAFFLGGILFLAVFSMMLSMGQRMFGMQKVIVPKVIVDNFGKKEAPFFDATGAHAGALLGDVLHDPFQCFSHLQVVHKLGVGDVQINNELDKLFFEHEKNIKRNENNYEAIFLPKNEMRVWGETDGSISPVEVLSSNRQDHIGEMIKLITSENKGLVITPEHKVALWKNGKIAYVEAGGIEEGDEIVSSSDGIIDEQDIINTFDERQQKLAKSYYHYLKLKTQNSSWGYKRLATKLGVSSGRTRWWWDNHSAPVPVQTVEWLKKQGLVHLKIDNPKLQLIAKVLGATFGDGGITENLNEIFFSSSELEATQEFGRDLMSIFGYSIDNNMRTTRGGINETSFCYHNTNRNIIRFFKALGAPIGKKTTMNLVIPSWIPLHEEFEHEFYGSLLGSEIGISSDGKCGARIEFGISGEPKLQSNRIQFLTKIICYLDRQGIAIGKIHNYSIKKYEGTRRIFRFILSQKLENTEKFAKNVTINYCIYKKDNLKKYLSNFEEKMHKKYCRGVNKGQGAEKVMNKLGLKQHELYNILNNIGVPTA
ncbi:MAG TPA: ATP-binding protein [Candidatus Nanoarchaeia archaeon]|nr:ATP-binding protein [Candidatus Nanoarchaeia archaeon]